MTDEILDIILLHTNENIREDCARLSYSLDRLKKSPYLKATDLVGRPIRTLEITKMLNTYGTIKQCFGSEIVWIRKTFCRLDSDPYSEFE